MVSAMGKRSRRKCFVISCGSNADDNPNKIFLCVPRNPEIRKRWFEAVGMPNAGPNRSLYCCEDHFDLETDCRNWMFYKMVGSRMRLKEDVVPHKFNCQGIAKGSDDSQLPSSDRRLKVEMMKKIKEEICSEKGEARNLNGMMVNGVSNESPMVSACDRETMPPAGMGKLELFSEVNIENISATRHTEAVKLEAGHSDNFNKKTDSSVSVNKEDFLEQFECEFGKPKWQLSTLHPNSFQLEADCEESERQDVIEGILRVKKESISEQEECEVNELHGNPSSPMHPDIVVEDYENFQNQEMVPDFLIVEQGFPEQYECEENEIHEQLTSALPESVSMKGDVDMGKLARHNPSSSDDGTEKSLEIDSRLEENYKSIEAETMASALLVVKGEEGSLDQFECEIKEMDDRSLPAHPGSINGRLGYGNSETEAIGIDPEDLEDHLLCQLDSADVSEESAPVNAQERRERSLEKLSPTKYEDQRDRGEVDPSPKRPKASPSKARRRKRAPQTSSRKIRK